MTTASTRETKASLAVVHRHATNAWHGALRTWRLGGAGDAITDRIETLPTAHAGPQAALAEARMAWPDASEARRHDAGAPALAETDLPPGCEVTIVTARGPARRSGGGRDVEVRMGRDALPSAVDAAAVDLLATMGALAITSSSGNDHGLANRYDHYARA